jgi:hypothetical protein
MSLVRTALTAGAIALACAPHSHAQTNLAGALGMQPAPNAYRMQRPQGQSSLLNLGLRAGVMVTPRGAAVVGLDFGLPQLSLHQNWEGRIDGDVIIKANLAGANTIVPVTFDQIFTSPTGGFGGRSSYFGVGVGALLGGKAKLDGKVLLGFDITSKLGVEVNYHIAEDNRPLLVFLARTHM